MKRFIVIWILLSAGLNIWQMQEQATFIKANTRKWRARLPDYFNNNNDGKLIKWKESRRFRGGKVWAKRT